MPAFKLAGLSSGDRCRHHITRPLASVNPIPASRMMWKKVDTVARISARSGGSRARGDDRSDHSILRATVPPTSLPLGMRCLHVGAAGPHLCNGPDTPHSPQALLWCEAPALSTRSSRAPKHTATTLAHSVPRGTPQCVQRTCRVGQLEQPAHVSTRHGIINKISSMLLGKAGPTLTPNAFQALHYGWRHVALRLPPHED